MACAGRVNVNEAEQADQDKSQDGWTIVITHHWHATLDALIKKNSLSPFIARVTEKVISMRTGIHFDVLDQVGQGESQIPILLFHGISDTTAPIAVSDTFASAHSNVTYHRIAEAKHTQCWNANSQMYEGELRSFVTHVLDLMVI